MATGVPERDIEFSRTDLEILGDAFKRKEFCNLFAQYCEEVTNPENQALYQKEMTQYEKERGNDITFINPKAGYVIKTSVAGDRKAFINICSNETVAKPSCHVKIVNGKRGLDWQIPYTLAPPREDYDKKKVKCVIYDIVFHPDTLRLAQNNQRFKELVNVTAFDSLESTYGIELDRKNYRTPKISYKGHTTASVIRKPDPYFKQEDLDTDGLNQELIDKIYPQQSHNVELPSKPVKQKPKQTRPSESKSHYTTPKYKITQQKSIDIQDYTFDKDCKLDTAIPSRLSIEISLPLISSTADCILDVKEKQLSLVCEKPACYKLKIPLPYSVDHESGDAKFDKSKRKLIISLPVIKTFTPIYRYSKDSGLESEETGNSNSDEEETKALVTEVQNLSVDEQILNREVVTTVPEIQENNNTIISELFLNPNFNYKFPEYSNNVMDNLVAFTFQVKNADPESVCVMKTNSVVQVKFTSIGSGYVPVHYAALIKFDDDITIDSASAESWDNNVILQIEVPRSVPEFCYIGTEENQERIELTPSMPITPEHKTEEIKGEDKPIIEVTSSNRETSITVTSNDSGSEASSIDLGKEKKIVWIGSSSSDTTKGILRKKMGRSISESSVGEVASSNDYISSDFNPESSSLSNKTVRFSDVNARYVYRYNSSIEAQKRKNQRKKMKKRNQERKKSESDCEQKPQCQDNLKKVESKPGQVKERRDSGVSETDTEVDSQRNTSNVTCDTVKHDSTFYDPNKLNKGKYLEVNFKNELIFDLDM